MVLAAGLGLRLRPITETLPKPLIPLAGRTLLDRALDALLLLHPAGAATGYDGKGDFFRKPDGALDWRGDAARAPYVFTGVQMLHPRLFEGSPDGRFSLTVLYDRARAAGRLAGVVHDGDWHHIGTPAGLAEARARLGAGADGG